jgi:4-amino-4-deoxy-L-arabinose transferase-like glycosyltransferase
MEERQDYRLFWIVLIALLLLTRIPAMANYFTIDNVNLALSLEKFDPRVHQPQPPGYPFFVLFARIVNILFHNAERTFLTISLLVSAASLVAAFALASRMFSRWAGAAASLLLLVNPVFWHAGLDGPLRPNLALFSLLTAYCCWRCWSGEKSFVYWGAVALGIGSGVRPDLIAFLFPLWLVSSWAGTKSWLSIARGLALLGVIVFAWTGALIVAMGGLRQFASVMFSYGVEQSGQGSVVFGSSIVAWIRQINRLVIWNALAVIGWIWAAPVWFRTRERFGQTVSFFFVWLVPGFIVQALVHVDAPGHTLFSVAALCVLGGNVLSLARTRDFALAAALLVNAIFFLDFFELPANQAAPGRTPSVKNAILFGSFEASLGMVRYLDEITRTTLKEIEEFTPKDRPSVIITTNMYVDQFFMNWRIGRYYLPKRDFWVLYNDIQPKRVERIQRNATMETRETAPLQLPIFREGRILWLIEPGSAFQKRLAAVQKLAGGKYVFYSDITPDAPPFTIDDIQIMPER